MSDKIRFPQLAAMAFFLDGAEGEYRFAASHAYGQRTTEWYVASGKGGSGKHATRRCLRETPNASDEERAADERRRQEFADSMGGSENVDFGPLVRAGYVTSGNAVFFQAVEKFRDMLEGDRPDAGVGICRPTKAGREWWEAEGRALHAKALAKRQAQRKAARRTVLIGVSSAAQVALPPELARRWPDRLPLPVPKQAALRPAFTATVLKETEQRVYVTDLREVNKDRPEPWRGVVQGRAPRQYVDRANVIADRVDAAAVERLVAIDREARQDFADACVRTVEEILPAVERLWQRADQQEAMRQDLVREALAGLGPREETGGAKPK